MLNFHLEVDSGYGRWLKNQPVESVKSKVIKAFQKAIEEGKFVMPRYSNIIEEFKKYGISDRRINPWPYRLPVYDRLSQTWNFHVREPVGMITCNEIETISHNKQNVKTMKHEITTERILQAASSCDTARNILKILFPEAFPDHRDSEHFCTVGQVLSRKGQPAYYQYAIIMVIPGVFQIKNLTKYNVWNTSKRTASELGMGQQGAITRGMFKKFLDQTSFSIDEFTPSV